MRYKSMYLSSLFFCSTVLLFGLGTTVHADCSQGGCPKGQRCVGDGKSPILKCVPEPPPLIWGFSLPMPSDPPVVTNAPSQQPNCYKDSDCRTGYKCGKGDLDPNSPEYANFHGDCGRAEQTACRTDQDCLSDEYCQHSKLINNATGAVCFERPLAKN
jgi:hypothetical protein